MLAPNCSESAATIRIPSPLLFLMSKSAGNSTPSSRTDTRTIFASRQNQAYPNVPIYERCGNAYLAALVTSSLTTKANEIARSGSSSNFLSALEFEFAVRGCTDRICTYLLEVCAKIDFLNIRIAG